MILFSELFDSAVAGEDNHRSQSALHFLVKYHVIT